MMLEYNGTFWFFVFLILYYSFLQNTRCPQLSLAGTSEVYVFRADVSLYFLKGNGADPHAPIKAPFVLPFV